MARTTREMFEMLYDRSDAHKWAHPELEEAYAVGTGVTVTDNFAIYDQERSREERMELVRQGVETATNMYSSMDVPVEVQIVKAPGCPEEPETEVETVIYTPKAPAQGKRPVVFAVSGGGMFATFIEAQNFWKWCDPLDCVVVSPRYRGVYQGKYPAALNDCHAGYQYVVDHADELGVDPDRIVLIGDSSGTNMAVSLAFRLKRYGYRPRGCVTVSSFMDNRPIYETRTIRSGVNWDARMQFLASVEYLGTNNLAWADSPEFYPAYAMAEDCLGLCPIFIHTDSEEASSGSCRAFIDKLSKAGVYNELHVWGGSCHGTLTTHDLMGGDTEYLRRFKALYSGNISDCLKYDLRRSWINEELGL